jgi:hypothetical protein
MWTRSFCPRSLQCIGSTTLFPDARDLFRASKHVSHLFNIVERISSSPVPLASYHLAHPRQHMPLPFVLFDLSTNQTAPTRMYVNVFSIDEAIPTNPIAPRIRAPFGLLYSHPQRVRSLRQQHYRLSARSCPLMSWHRVDSIRLVLLSSLPSADMTLIIAYCAYHHHGITSFGNRRRFESHS